MSDRQRILERLRKLMEEAEAIGPDVVGEMRLLLSGGESVSGGSLHATPAPRPKAEAGAWRGLIGTSPGMLKVRDLVRKFAPADVPVMLTGESGTGKDLVARALHEESPRCKATMACFHMNAIRRIRREEP